MSILSRNLTFVSELPEETEAGLLLIKFKGLSVEQLPNKTMDAMPVIICLTMGLVQGYFSISKPILTKI